MGSKAVGGQVASLLLLSYVGLVVGPAQLRLGCAANIVQSTAADNNIDDIYRSTADRIGNREASVREGGGGNDGCKGGFLADLAGTASCSKEGFWKSMKTLPEMIWTLY